MGLQSSQPRVAKDTEIFDQEKNPRNFGKEAGKFGNIGNFAGEKQTHENLM